MSRKADVLLPANRSMDVGQEEATVDDTTELSAFGDSVLGGLHLSL